MKGTRSHWSSPCWLSPSSCLVPCTPGLDRYHMMRVGTPIIVTRPPRLLALREWLMMVHLPCGTMHALIAPLGHRTYLRTEHTLPLCWQYIGPAAYATPGIMPAHADTMPEITFLSAQDIEEWDADSRGTTIFTMGSRVIQGKGEKREIFFFL